MRMKPVGSSGLRGVAWSGLEAAVAGGLSLASALVVARLAGPAEFGVAAAAVAVHVLLWVVATALFADALVQRPTLQPGDAASAAWAAGGVGLLAAGVQVAAGGWLAAALGDARLPAMGWALAAPLPLVGVAGAAQGLLTRQLGYRRLALRTLIGQGLGTLVGLAMAAEGAGAWALVGQQAVGSGVGALVLLLPPPGGLIGWPHWRPVRQMLSLGLPLTAATLLQAARYRVFAVLVGAAAGPAALGQLHLAFRLVDTVRELANNALWRLLLPRFAPLQDDVPALQRAVDRALGGYCAVLLPLLGLMLLVIRPLVLGVLGESWLPAAGAGLLLILLAAQDLLGFAGKAALIARGRPAGPLAYQAATFALTLGLCLLSPPRDPWHGALLWAAATLLPWPWLLARIGRAMQTTPLRQLRAGMPALLATAAAAAAAFALPDPDWLGGAGGQTGGQTGEALLLAQRVLVFVVAGAVVASWPLLASRARAFARRRGGGARVCAAGRAGVMRYTVSTSLACAACRVVASGLKDAARRLRRSPAAILDPGRAAAAWSDVAGTKERSLQPNQGTLFGSGDPDGGVLGGIAGRADMPGAGWVALGPRTRARTSCRRQEAVIRAIDGRVTPGHDNFRFVSSYVIADRLAAANQVPQ